MKIEFAVKRIKNLAFEMKTQPSYEQRAIAYATIKIILLELEQDNREHHKNNGNASCKINDIDEYAKVLAHLDDVHKRPDEEIWGYLDKAIEQLEDIFHEKF
jgi:hypothetical protein